MEAGGINNKNSSGRVVALFGEVLADVFPDRSVLGGAPFNVARHLRAFGMHPVLITRVGHDQIRDSLLKEMHDWDLDISGVQHDPVYPSGQVQVLLEGGNHRYDILPDQAYDHIHAGLAHMTAISYRPELAYFGTLAQRGMPSRLAMDKFLSDGKCPRFLDINLRAPWYNRHTIKRSLLRADFVKMNEEELGIISEYFKIKEPNSQQKALVLADRFEIRQLLVTAGAAGSWLLNEQELYLTEPAEVLHSLIDTVGAGDAFAAVFIKGLLEGWDTQITLQRANQFAAAICGIRGAAPKSLDFYIPFKKAWNI